MPAKFVQVVYGTDARFIVDGLAARAGLVLAARARARDG